MAANETDEGNAGAGVVALAAKDVTESARKVTLRSSDGEEFEVEEATMLQSGMIKNVIEDSCASSTIPVFNVTGSILAKVIEYLKRHSDDGAKAKAAEDSGIAHVKGDIEAWEEEFIDVEQEVLFDLILAANYLNIKSLLDLCCQTVADMMKGKTPRQIRKTFNITNDYTPEEEEEVRRENPWAFV